MEQPFGTWLSEISAQTVAAQGLRLSHVSVDGDAVYWIEGRPREGGRSVLVRRRSDGHVEDVVPSTFNVRTRVHEYGGGSYVIADGTAYCSNFADQRLYRVALDPSQGTDPMPVTPAGAWFYADTIVDLARRRLIAVREDHTDPGREPVTTLVSVPLDGPPHAGQVLASGYDFYSTPRLSPDGSRVSWLAWRHPQMPWDGTELWVAAVDAMGLLDQARCVAGGPSESIYQPGWTLDGELLFASDRTGWWRLYRSHSKNAPNVPNDPNDPPVLLHPPSDAEFGRPQWVFGGSTWVPAGPGRLAVSYTRDGHWHLATLDLNTGAMSEVGNGLEPREWLAATSTHVVLVAGSATSADAVVRIDLRTGVVETLRASSSLTIDTAQVSVPESVWFPSPTGMTHAFYYPPRHAAYTGPEGERPPLIVISHGGPTTATSATLDLRVQFWTNRGFAVADVNYGGSSGFGRAYRDRLRGGWGVVDVDDVVSAARYLAARGRADPDRLAIRGGSAGGYTTLAALTFRPGVFKAGASYYGISDLEVLARDTHKFEARYLERLVGPYPASRDLYVARSPIHFVDQMASALILFQGLEDKVVPPNQSEMMAVAVRAKGLPVEYLAFEGEQHGFRKADTIVRCLEAELQFYGRVFALQSRRGAS